jgi:hypothetical protein
MPNRDLSRRLIRLEAERLGRSVRYTVSDRVLSDDEWLADMDGERSAADHELGPVMTIEEWEAEFCTAS